MKAETPGINGVFKNSTVLNIPFFQRQYVWGEKEWERFANDMDSLIGLRKKYFLGSLIFQSIEPTEEEEAYGVSEKFIVVDGQQRLTTLSIYLKALISYMMDEQLRNNFHSSFFIQNGQRHPVLHHSLNDRAAFQDVMWGNTLENYPEKQVVKAYRYFQGRLRGRSADELRSLWMAVFSHIKFVEVILDNSDDEQQIFDTINSLGVDLTIDELMKNYLYDVTEELAYLNNWKPVFDTDESRKFWGTNDAARSQASSDENKVISNFFYDYVRIKMWEYREKKGFDRKGFVQKSQIFSTCKAFVELFHTPKQELANEIIEYAKLYKQYFDKENLNIRVPMASCIERVACIAMAKVSTIIPYLLYVLKNVPNLAERNKIFDFLETYLVRRMVGLPNNADKMAPEFYSEQLIGNRIDTYAKLKEYIGSIDEDKTMHMPGNEEIARNINHIAFGDEATPRLIFYLQETKRNLHRMRGYNYFCCENILPKPTKASEVNYPPFIDETLEQERKNAIKSIGNFLLLVKPEEEDAQEAMNKALKKVANELFAAKKAVLKDYLSDIICTDWFKNQTKWTVEDVQKRNSLISKAVSQLWPL